MNRFLNSITCTFNEQIISEEWEGDREEKKRKKKRKGDCHLKYIALISYPTNKWTLKQN